MKVPFYPKINHTLLNQARRHKDIIYGAQSIKAQIGSRARRTTDFDIFTRKPKPSAVLVERKIERFGPGNQFYIQKGSYGSTWKVRYVGKDKKPMTADDINVVDYSKTPSPKPLFVVKHGVRYRSISEELAAKRRVVNDSAYAYRHAKDAEDIRRITGGKG